jgi:hypothetical protein
VQSSGASRNAAWLTTPTRKATSTQVKNAKGIVDGCLG